jgi:mitochondrial fission protein ELM1
MDPKEICDQLDNILQTHLSAEIWVTTSRRTPKQVEENLKSRSIDYLHLYSEEPYNPIPAFIHLCDHLYVTTDSTSMLSECVSSGNAQVSLIHTACSPKHQEMVKSLQRRNLIDTDQKIDISPYIQKVRKILNLHV